MEQSNQDDTELVSRLKELPLKPVPPYLTDRIMESVSKRQPGFFLRFWRAVSQPINISMSPAYLFCLILVISGAFLLGRISTQRPVELQVIATSPPPSPTITTDNAQAAYMIGRGLLEADKQDQAVPLLQQAALLEPDNPEYAYWDGISYWLKGNQERERQSYLRGLAAAPDSVPLLVNLGHNYLNEQKYEQALSAYKRAFTLSPDEQVALYNSGLIYRKLGLPDEEIAAWKAYLQVKRTGKWAFRAVERLNAYSDFSYRSYQIGVRKVILSPEVLFDDSLSAEQHKAELSPLAAILENNNRLKLDIVIFIEHDLEMARKKAQDIRRLIVNSTEAKIKNRVKLSWFDKKESITLRDTVNIELAEGLLIFSNIVPVNEKEVSI
jgi:tetratricopeptide (TPR) repeat protein